MYEESKQDRGMLIRASETAHSGYIVQIEKSTLKERRRAMKSPHIMGFAAFALLACAAPGWATESTATPEQPTSLSGTVPLYTNLGSHHKRISTRVPATQQYFDQGLRLVYGFNHAEAIRSFTRAADLDPTCAMCYWGIALAYGPHVNAPMDAASGVAAYAAVQKALAFKSYATAPERAYIEALAQRYEADPPADRARLDTLYSRAMGQVAKTYPKDLDAATLYAESLMDTSPWNYWQPDGTPHPFTPEVLDTLESVLADDPDHLGAIHLYIHATEASDNPGRAERYADTLLTLAPGAGHLVHMPAHTYLRTGRYADATASNEAAAEADEAYLAGGHSYYTVESHVNFGAQAKVGDRLYATVQLLHHDPKRLHYFCVIHRAENGSENGGSENGSVVATSEQMLLHVDTVAGKASPASGAIVAKLDELAAKHKTLPRPANAGRQVGQPRA